MRPLEQLRSVFLSVLANKFRVFLTSLGIIIGTFTIIMVVGIGKASQDAVTEEYKRLSAETITIAKAQSSMGVRINSGPGGMPTIAKSLTKEQAVAMADELEHVRSVGVGTSTNSPIVYGVDSKDAAVMGITLEYADITHLNIYDGEFFADEDGEARNRVVVLGYNVAEYFFGEDVSEAVGEKVYIKGSSFTVTGVLERVGGSGGVSSAGRNSSVGPDDTVYIPFDVALKYTSGATGTRSMGGAAVMQIGTGSASTTFVAMAYDIAGVKDAIEEISDYIYDIVGDRTSYTVTDAGSTLTSALKTSNTMSALLIAVAIIVLVVSGIGIMNVLLVAVKERTREIGILKSVGASRFTILTEFLLEAVFISVLGGTLGVLLSYFAPQALAYSEIAYSASLNGILLGFGFSVVTGIFFGYYPANKASKLKPIDALNVE